VGKPTVNNFDIPTIPASFLNWLPRQTTDGHTYYVVNETGHFLRHPDVAQEWGFDVPEAKGATVQHLFADQAQTLTSGTSPMIQHDGRHGMLVSVPIHPNSRNAKRTWSLITSIPTRYITQRTASIKQTFFLVTIASIDLVLFVTLTAIRLTKSRVVKRSAAQKKLKLPRLYSD
jgi:hypothetical protein